jgi:2-amino-4-hydroxy-6-hydroxymethyldihydropteridine diphosphokinase
MAAPAGAGDAGGAAGWAKLPAAATGATTRAVRMTPMDDRRLLKPRKESTIAYIGLGANLGDRETTIAEALRRVDEDDRTSVLRSTSPIETDPVGYEDQPRFLNAAARVATTWSARELLALLLEVERGLGRVRGDGPRYGPRTIDLDLLLYGWETIDEPGLEIPHPRLHERRFVLEPLAELDSDLVVPGRGPVSALLAELE